MSQNGNKPSLRTIFMEAQDGEYFEREKLREMSGVKKMRAGGDVDPIVSKAGGVQRRLAKKGILILPVKENKRGMCSRVLGWQVGKTKETKDILLHQQAARVESTQHVVRRSALGEHYGLLTPKEGTKALIKDMLLLIQSTYGESELAE